MQLLTTTNVYDVDRDQSNREFLRLVQNPPDGIVILDGNAGLGADWPAGVWKSLNATAIALAIFSVPSTLEENWPRWKEIYDSVVEQILEFHGEFRVDRDTAQVLAMHHAFSELGLNTGRMSIHMAVRHYFCSMAGYEDLLAIDRVEMDWPEHGEYGSEEFSRGVRSNEEAARQAICRYIFGIDDTEKITTVVIEQDGRISFSKDLRLSKEWG